LIVGVSIKLTTAKELLQLEPESAVTFLLESKEFGLTIERKVNDLRENSKLNEEITFFKNSKDLIFILEFRVKKGELIIEIDQPLKYGLILNKMGSIISKDAKYLETKKSSPEELHYSFDSAGREFGVFLIMFRPENVQNQQVMMKIDFSDETNYKDLNGVIHENLFGKDNENPKTSVNSFIIISLVVVGAIIVIITIIGLICYMKRRRQPQTRTSGDSNEHIEKNKSTALNVSQNTNNTNNIMLHHERKETNPGFIR
jgi:hypothetical protein